jgi:hypothetical protein
VLNFEESDLLIFVAFVVFFVFFFFFRGQKQGRLRASMGDDLHRFRSSPRASRNERFLDDNYDKFS